MGMFHAIWRRFFSRKRKSYRQVVMDAHPIAVYLWDDPGQGP